MLVRQYIQVTVTVRAERQLTVVINTVRVTQPLYECAITASGVIDQSIQFNNNWISSGSQG